MEPQTKAKTAAEVRVYEFNFEAQPEIVNGSTITAVNTCTATPSGLTLGTPAIEVSGKRVQVQISSGTAGTRYTLKCIVDLNTGERLEMSGVLSIFAFADPNP